MSVGYMRIGDFDRKDLKDEQIRVAFLTKLPYRLRVGALKRFHLDWSKGTEVVLYNALDIPVEATQEQNIAYIRENAKYHTDLLIITRPIKIIPRELDELRDDNSIIDKSTGMLAPDIYNDRGDTTVLFRDTEPQVREIFTNFMSVYYHVGRHKSTFNELRDYNNFTWDFEVAITCPEEYNFTQSEIDKLVALFSLSRIKTSMGNVPELNDFDDEILKQFDRLFSKKPAFMYYQFALEAHCRYTNGDHIMGFLMMVISLEAVHAAFVRAVFDERLHQDEKKVEKAIDQYIVGVGIFKLMTTTPPLFMDSYESPTSAEITACQKGIEDRNKIMHAKSSLGKFKIEGFTEEAAWKSYQAVKVVYEKYVAAIERRNLTPSNS